MHRLLLCWSLFLLPAVAAGQLPGTIGYQGRLLKSDGTPEIGSKSMTFSLYAAENGGPAVWTETQTLGLSDGYYATALGSVVPFGGGIFEGGTLFLEVAVDSTALSPRQKLAAVPYAFLATNVKGGVVDASAIMVGGKAVIDGGGKLTGAAAYSAGSGIAISGNSISLPSTCNAGEVLRWNGNGWQCSTAGSSNYTAGDGLALNGTSFAIASAGCTNGQVLKWSGSAWGCAQDADTLFSAGSGLALSGSNQFSVNFAGNGTATTASRSDHNHDDLVARNLPTTTRASCNAILGASESTGSGLYWIDPDGAGGNPAFMVYCDMVTSSGGWTLVTNVEPADGNVVSFTNTRFWTGNAEWGQIGNHFTKDYKSPAAYLLSGTNIMIQVANPGPQGKIIGWKTWSMSAKSFDTFFDSANNTVQTMAVTGQDVANVYAYEPLLKNGNQLVSNKLMNPNSDRVRLGTDGITSGGTTPLAQGDDNEPGLGTQMNEASCAVGTNCYRYWDVELWVNSASNLWCTNPGSADGQFKWIGSDGGDGPTSGGCSLVPGRYSPYWTYRIYVK